MEKLVFGKKYDRSEIFLIQHNNLQKLGNLPIYDISSLKYALIISYFPLKDSKLKIYKKLNRKQKLGFLNRHILSVGRKLELPQILLKKAKGSSKSYKITKKYAKESEYDNFWKNSHKRDRNNIDEYYNIIMDIIIDEIKKYNNTKYSRKMKLEKIYDDNI